MEKKEKRWGLTTADIIKYVIVLASLISAYYAGVYANKSNKERIEKLEQRMDISEAAQSAAALEVAKMNGKLDILLTNVQSIYDVVNDRNNHN